MDAKLRAEAETYDDRPLVWVLCDLLQRGLKDRERERKRRRRS